MTTATEYVGYSVGGYLHSGARIGKEFDDLTAATAYLRHLEDLDHVASAILYGWPENGDCEEVDGFAR